MGDEFDAYDASTILTLLDVATEGRWPQVMEQMREEYGYTPEQMHSAWKALDGLAGSDTCPSLEDFNR